MVSKRSVLLPSPLAFFIHFVKVLKFPHYLTATQKQNVNKQSYTYVTLKTNLIKIGIIAPISSIFSVFAESFFPKQNLKSLKLLS